MLFGDPEEELDDEAPAAESKLSRSGLVPPREMAECFGHEDIERQLLGLFNEGRFPHALIFAGPEGIGKSTMAFRLARFLLNDKPTENGPSLFDDPLPTAKPESLQVPAENPVFRQVATGGHPDFLLIERIVDEKKGKLQGAVAVDEVRRVTPFLRMKAARDGGWRVVIIDDADTMTVSSQNAILKILEEPPPNTVLILIAHRPGAMVPPIRSRCRVFSFNTLPLEIFAALMRREYPEIGSKDIESLHAITHGSAGQGLNLFTQGGIESVGNVLALLSSWPRLDWQQIHAQAETIGRSSTEDALKSFSTVLLWITESILRARATGRSPSGILNNNALLQMMNHYPLADWVQICENLRVHFETVGFANLDKQQAVIGAFSVLDHKEAA